MKMTLEMRVLKRAVEILGSERALARRLHVPVADLCIWMAGAETPPRATFLRAVDVMIERNDAPGLSDLHSLSDQHIDGLEGLAFPSKDLPDTRA